MAEYIGIKRRVKYAGDVHTELLKAGWDLEAATLFVNDIPDAADVVEMVRCRECAIPHNKYTGCPKLNGLVTPPDFYCPYGERRTDVSGNT